MSVISKEEQNKRELMARIKALTSSDELITRVIERAGYSPPFAKVRITEGFSNEVYRVKTASNQELIVRIHWYESPYFAPEAWALTQCETYGIQSPRFLYLEQNLPGDIPRSVCIETVLPGRTLHSLLKEKIILLKIVEQL